MAKYFPNASVQIIYGCTEAEPISHANGSSALESKIDGYFVGELIPEVKMELLNIESTQRLDGLKIFELKVHGQHVDLVFRLISTRCEAR